MLDFWTIYNNATSVSGVVLLFTIFALIFSTKYTLSRIGKIWEVGDPRKVSSADDKESENGDGEECDGDDEAEDEDYPKHGKKGDGDNPYVQGLDGRDPVEYCEHIQGEVKRVKQRVTTKKIEENLTQDQIQEERDVQRKQLEQIFKLMEGQQDRFGVSSISDVKHQMSLYG